MKRPRHPSPAIIPAGPTSRRRCRPGSSPSSATPNATARSSSTPQPCSPRERRIGDYRKAHLWGAEAALFERGTERGRDLRHPARPARRRHLLRQRVPRSPPSAGARRRGYPRAAGQLAAHRRDRTASIRPRRSRRWPRHGPHDSRRSSPTDQAPNAGVAWTGGTAVIDEDGWVAALPDESGIGPRHADTALPRRQVAAAAQRPVRRSPTGAVLRDGCRGIRPCLTRRAIAPRARRPSPAACARRVRPGAASPATGRRPRAGRARSCRRAARRRA